MVPDQSTVDKAKSLMEKVRNGEVVTQEEADTAVSGSTESTASENIAEPGTVAAETQTDAAAEGAGTEGSTATDGTAANTTTQQ